MIGDGEAVRLVADALQQIERLAVAGQDHRVGLGGDPHLFEAFGQTDHRHIPDTQFAEYRLCRVDLCRTAVDDVEIGRIGEPAARFRPILDVVAEPAPGHLGDRRDIIGATAAGGIPDREMPVVGFAWQAVLENHQRTDHIGALHVTDVDAFDPQRRLGQSQRVLDTLQRRRPRGEVRCPPELVLLQRLLRVAPDGVGQRPLVPPAGDP